MGVTNTGVVVVSLSQQRRRRKFRQRHLRQKFRRKHTTILMRHLQASPPVNDTSTNSHRKL